MLISRSTYHGDWGVEQISQTTSVNGSPMTSSFTSLLAISKVVIRIFIFLELSLERAQAEADTAFES